MLNNKCIRSLPGLTETATMRTKGRSPESSPIVYCTYSDLCMAESSLLQIMDTEVTPQWTKYKLADSLDLLV